MAVALIPETIATPGIAGMDAQVQLYVAFSIVVQATVLGRCGPHPESTDLFADLFVPIGMAPEAGGPGEEVSNARWELQLLAPVPLA